MTLTSITLLRILIAIVKFTKLPEPGSGFQGFFRRGRLRNQCVIQGAGILKTTVGDMHPALPITRNIIIIPIV